MLTFATVIAFPAYQAPLAIGNRSGSEKNEIYQAKRSYRW
jgi:hypothetical protein